MSFSTFPRVDVIKTEENKFFLSSAITTNLLLLLPACVTKGIPQKPAYSPTKFLRFPLLRYPIVTAALRLQLRLFYFITFSIFTNFFFIFLIFCIFLPVVTPGVSRLKTSNGLLYFITSFLY